LLVWEWQSESYVLKQQGHYFDVNTLSWSEDGHNIATGGDDGKVKLWNTTSGFCFVTFSDHTSSVSTVQFAKQGQVLFSASLDGTVRAYDLLRYRNFRTFTSPSPVQFSSLAVDPSGEVVAAGSIDSFEIYMWSVQTGKLLDILTGHEGPISALEFSPSGNVLTSGSWDKTIRTWNVFGRSRAVEPLQLSSEVLAVTFRPDGKELAASSLDGQITFFDINEGKQIGLIEGRKDASGGRKADDRVTAANNTSGKSFNSLAYTADGSCIIAGGNTKYVLIYNVREGVMIKKFQISQNLSLDGTQEFLDSRLNTEAGPYDDRGDESDLEDRLDTSLPGAMKGDASKRRYRPEARTKCVRFSPTGRSWAAASTEGLLIYSVDEDIAFDPFELDIDLTPQSILDVLSKREYLKALIMAFRLNEKVLIQKVYENTPTSDIKLIVRQLPTNYLANALGYIGERLDRSPHVEFDLLWINALLSVHGRYLREHSVEFASFFRAVNKGLTEFQQSVTSL
jgi:periodic tryptophan protein 2